MLGARPKPQVQTLVSAKTKLRVLVVSKLLKIIPIDDKFSASQTNQHFSTSCSHLLYLPIIAIFYAKIGNLRKC